MNSGDIWAALLRPIGSALAGKAGDKIRDALLGQVMTTHEKEMEALLRIEKKIDLLQKGPFNEGLTWMREANRSHRKPNERKHDLELARQAFVKAEAQMEDYEKAVSQIYIAIVYAVTNRSKDSSFWLRAALSTADTTVRNLVEDAESKRGSILWGSFGRAKKASKNALEMLKMCQSLIKQVGVAIRIKPQINWSYACKSWEEEVFTGGAGEQHDSLYSTVTKRAIEVRRNKETWLLEYVVTIGMPVTRHPSHRSQRALLMHWAPASGSGVKAIRWMVM